VVSQVPCHYRATIDRLPADAPFTRRQSRPEVHDNHQCSSPPQCARVSGAVERHDVKELSNSILREGGACAKREVCCTLACSSPLRRAAFSLKRSCCRRRATLRLPCLDAAGITCGRRGPHAPSDRAGGACRSPGRSDCPEAGRGRSRCGSAGRPRTPKGRVRR